jgi:formylglycine-generating enzyme required for sulfatase activity
MYKYLVCYIFFGISLNLFGNNIQLTNISVANNATNTGKVIQFDLSWENSWRSGSTGNYDGAWVFFKFKDNDGTWRHLNFTGTNVVMPFGASYDMGNNGSTTGVGMFIYRTVNGFGTVTATSIKAGIASYPGTFEVRGFAIEMVYIPQGSFWLGDGVLDGSRYSEGAGANAYQVTGTGNTITMGTAAGNLTDPQSNGFIGNLNGFPTGFEAYWMMKYELSQGAYRDFLNTLTYDQQVSRFSGKAPSLANACLSCDINNAQQINGRLEIKTVGNPAPPKIPAVVGCDLDNDNIYDEATDGEWNAMSFISWPDAAAYLDWSGLRPMTEMEFEKVARGPLVPVLHEYVWGNNTIATNSYTVSGNGTNNFIVTNAPAAVGNALYLAPTPASLAHFRGGIFANASSTRMSAGAGYYGAMELSGNVGEFAVFTWDAAGRSFTGKKGDGILDGFGDANENKWPGINGHIDDNLPNEVYGGITGVTGDAGIKIKGGYMGTIDNALEISSRNNCICTFILTSSYNNKMGIRGVRDAN